MINKDEIILTLVNLLTSINEAAEISNGFHYERELTGWRNLKLDIRWLDRRE